VKRLYMDKNEGRVGTVVEWERVESEGLARVSGDTTASLRVSLLNIGSVEGSVRAIRSKELGMSSELSDRLCGWEEGQKSAKR